jgi:hypothetical protein
MRDKGRGGQLFERLLLARLETYGQNHDLRDVDACIAHLKATHREYTRQKAGPFRTQVARVAAELLKRQGVEDGAQVGPDGSLHCVRVAAAAPLLTPLSGVSAGPGGQR